jgi:hypothetical protein
MEFSDTLAGLGGFLPEQTKMSEIAADWLMDCGLDKHLPLDRNNRLRRTVHKIISQLRHDLAKTPGVVSQGDN